MYWTADHSIITGKTLVLALLLCAALWLESQNLRPARSFPTDFQPPK